MADDPRLLPKAVRDAWLNAVTSTEHELQRATARLREIVGLGADGDRFGAEFMARLRKQREEFERKVDEGVHTTVARIRAPIERELQTLGNRLEAVQRRLDARRKRKRR